MSLEVEQKFRVADLAAVLSRLTARSLELGGKQTQRDEYFAHPGRDFARTDEALRIRSCDEANRVTYKGPKQSAQTKTRREIEVGIAAGEAGRGEFRELLLALGFQPVRMVEKQRRTGRMRWQDMEVEVAVDHVVGLGDFIELEIVSLSDDFAAAERAVLSLAESLQLSEVERRSYLQMLLAKE
ncbi:MAG: class IV adenylate cyclase [Pirellulales bacterium]